MPTSKDRSRYEACLAGAHRALYRAAAVAEEIGDPGAQDDLIELQRHVSVLMDESLKGRRRPIRQLSVLDTTRA